MEKYKGIHPVLVLERELKKRQLKKRPFALSLQEYPQVLNDITKGKRGFTPALLLKFDQALGFEEGTMLLLQTWYEIKKEQQKANSSIHPDLFILRKALFWDTDINKIDWQRQYEAVIKRVYERGNELEKKEIINYYGEEKVKAAIGDAAFAENRLLIMPHLKLK